MKKRTFLYLSVICTCSIIFSSYYTGVAISGNLDCTGAETALNNPQGCSISGTCHTHLLDQTWIAVDLELDSAGLSTSHYTGGMQYTVKLTGTNTTTDSLPIFGFQITSIIGDTAAPIPTNAGTWNAPLPPATHYAAPQPGNFNLGLLEQNPAHPVTTGTGRLGSTYQVIFNWLAPASGTGDVSIWAALNAVNDNYAYDGDNYNVNHIVVAEWSPTVSVYSPEAFSNFNLSVYPNPAVDNIYLSYSLQNTSAVSVSIADMNGKVVLNLQKGIRLFGKQSINADVSGISKGIYFIDLNVDGMQCIKKLVVQ